VSDTLWTAKLELAAEEVLYAYRKQYCGLAKGGVRKNAPLQREIGELAVALNEIKCWRTMLGKPEG
jgi:hypothetical protein